MKRCRAEQGCCASPPVLCSPASASPLCTPGERPWVGVSPAPTSASLEWMHPAAGHALQQLQAGRGCWSPSGAGVTELLSTGAKKQAA